MFCHLHLHTEYSLLDGLGNADEYARRAAEIGQKYLACTDHGNIDGLIKFQKACDKNEITPIFGCEAYIVPNRFDRQKETRGHITLLVKNEIGWKNLCYILSKANLEGFYKRPRIDYELITHNCEGLVVMSACAGSFLRLNDADNIIEEIIKRTDFFFEIMPHDIEAQNEIHNIITVFQQDFDSPLVATNDCHYVLEGDYKSQEVLLAVQTKAKWDDPGRFKFGFKGLYLRTEREMIEAFKKQAFWDREDYLKAIQNTIKVAELCKDFRIDKREALIPSPPRKSRRIHDQTELENLVWQGFEQLQIAEFAQDEYIRRIKKELEIIGSKRFARYFLVVKNLIDWCRENDVAVGPGRGSVGGSLIAYCIGITQVDPIEHGLIFERFISETRKDWPDIDIDIEDRKRELVKTYMTETYGEDKVAGISNFGRMRAKAVIRDVGRVFNAPHDEVDEFAKTIIYEETNEEDVIEKFAEDSKFKKRYPEIISHAQKLENKVRHASQHAAALVISPEPLESSGRGVLVKRKDEVLINWSMDDAEYMGLVKLDLLGLNCLSVIKECLKLIEENHRPLMLFHCFFIGNEEDIINGDGHVENLGPLDLTKIKLNDNKIFDSLSEGNTVGIFQWGTWSMTKLAKEMKPRNFADMVAAIALVRPGPADSGVTEKYIERKNSNWRNKEKCKEYLDITKETFGLIVYQEQVMQFLHKIAGMSLTEADEIRKILAKKRDPKELEPYKERFLEGVEKLDLITSGEGKRFWEDLQNHAHYSFNKSHSVEYALLGYWTAWLKEYFPTEFICAALTCGQDGQKEELLKEAQRIGLNIFPPKVGISDPFIWVAKEKDLICPFVEIKGIGEKTADNCCVKIKKRLGFFKENKPQIEGKKINEILNKIDAFNPVSPLPEEAQNMFSFNFPSPDMPDRFELKKIRYSNRKAGNCELCELREECRRPIVTELGIYNVVALGEAPGRQEDKMGKPFYGPAGELLWQSLGGFGVLRKHLHIINTCRCYPSQTKTPKPEHIKACSFWLKDELLHLDFPLIFALGNIPLQALTGEKSGISKRVEKGGIEYIASVKSFVCWGMHPASVLRNDNNRKLFEFGIENFAKYFLKEFNK